ncbi:MAG: PIN domain-containing protein [Vicinamibacteria bacterium]|nr:PIN domain-containing protein [Vicinamibacteria bacterium]
MKFVDTNILLYAISKDQAERRKTNIAIELLEAPLGELALSVQVLQEFYVQATRVSRGAALPPRLAEDYIDHWRAFEVQDMTVELFRAAVTSSRRFKVSYWDAAIIEAARMMGCDTVLSEDLSHGQSYGGVRVRDPFLSSSAR